jgi:hypothetical protein
MNARTGPVLGVVVARLTSACEDKLDKTCFRAGSGLHFCTGLLLFFGAWVAARRRSRWGIEQSCKLAGFIG